MVLTDDIRPGNLLISANREIYCITEVIRNNEEPHKSIIIGRDEKNRSFAGTPDKWFHLWSMTCNIQEITM